MLFSFLFVLSYISAARIKVVERAIDLVQIGPYTISNCDATSSSEVVSAFNYLQFALKLAISDTGASSYAPSRAFQTFFKDSSQTPYVSAILTNISSGSTLSPPNSYSNGAPRLSCVSKAGQLSYQVQQVNGGTITLDAYTECIQSPDVPLFLLQGTMQVAICPNSWANKYPISIPPRNCLKVDTTINRFLSSGITISRYLPWILLEELAKYFIAATNLSSDGGENLPNISDVNKCASLGAEQSILNTHSYVFYVASELNARLHIKFKMAKYFPRRLWEVHRFSTTLSID